MISEKNRYSKALFPTAPAYTPFLDAMIMIVMLYRSSRIPKAKNRYTPSFLE